MLFLTFCGILERVSNAPQKAGKVRILEELWINLKALAQPQQHEDDQQKRGSDEPAKGDGVKMVPTASSAVGDVYFAFMRLLMPQLDSLRSTYGLKESKIAKLYVELLGLSPTSADAIRFLHWKDPSKNSIQSTSFSDVVYVVLGKRGYGGHSGIVANASPAPAAAEGQLPCRAATGGGGLTVTALNSELDLLCAAMHSTEKKAVLMRMLRRCSAIEHKWIIRIITKEMKMHLMHQSILAAFHPSAMELYNNTNDLAYVCKKCTEPSELLVAGDTRHGIFLFQPLKPMLASIVTSVKLTTLLQTEKLVVEPKYDGERMMIHATRGGKIQYWTRNAKNYTNLYGPKFDGTIAKALFERRDGGRLVEVSNVILDGEFLLYDSVAKEYKEFGNNRTFALGGGAEGEGRDGGGHAQRQAWGPSPQKGQPLAVRGASEGVEPGTEAANGEDEANSALWFCYQVFDIVLLNGESLLAAPLEKRKAALKSIVLEAPTKLEIAPFTTNITVVADILKQLDAALTANHEGIMIKVSGSHYVPGERRTKWMKLKPDHVSGLADTLDLVILGGYYGTKYGMRHISHFLLGVWKNESAPTPVSPGALFLTFCKVGTGYSEQELRELQHQLDSKWIPLPHGTVPSWLSGWKPGAGEVPDVYIDPKDSMVLEIFGYSFTPTTKFSFGQTLRFPRCHRVRSDKGVADATDLAQLVQIIHSSKENFSHKLHALSHQGDDADASLLMVQAVKRARKEEDARVKKEQLTLTRTIASIPSTIAMPLRQSVVPVSSFLEGYEVCILYSSPTVNPRQEIEKRVIANGGAIVAHPQPRTSLIVSSSATCPKVRHWVDMCHKKPAEMMEKFYTTSIIKLEWLLECLAVKQVLPLGPRHMVHTSPELHALFEQTLDPYQDSYFDPATRESLRVSIALATKQQGDLGHDATKASQSIKAPLAQALAITRLVEQSVQTAHKKALVMEVLREEDAGCDSAATSDAVSIVMSLIDAAAMDRYVLLRGTPLTQQRRALEVQEDEKKNNPPTALADDALSQSNIDEVLMSPTGAADGVRRGGTVGLTPPLHLYAQEVRRVPVDWLLSRPIASRTRAPGKRERSHETLFDCAEDAIPRDALRRDFVDASQFKAPDEVIHHRPQLLRLADVLGRGEGILQLSDNTNLKATHWIDEEGNVGPWW